MNQLPIHNNYRFPGIVIMLLFCWVACSSVLKLTYPHHTDFTYYVDDVENEKAGVMLSDNHDEGKAEDYIKYHFQSLHTLYLSSFKKYASLHEKVYIAFHGELISPPPDMLS